MVARKQMRWGQNEGRLLPALKDKWVKIAFTDGKVLKGAIKYLHQTASEEA